MLNSVKELIKSKPFYLPNILLYNYKKLDITDSELIILIYLINTDEIFNPKKIAKDLNFNLNDVMQILENLTEKNLIKIEIKNKKNREEVINIEELYSKLAFLVTKKENNNKNNNIFDIFEKEFSRTLSPLEYEMIIDWQNNFDESLIISALKEANSKKILNIKYIDKIIRNWHMNGIQKEENFNKKGIISNKELFDYDWLNERDS